MFGHVGLGAGVPVGEDWVVDRGDSLDVVVHVFDEEDVVVQELFVLGRIGGGVAGGY